MTFDYPDILRKDTGAVLTTFHDGGTQLIFTWWAFALLGLPLLIAYVLIGQKLETRLGFIRWVTTIGVISGIAQIIGLLRWVFVVPVIAGNYMHASDAATKAAAVQSFQTIHQYGGVLLGEHVGQLFTVIWTVMIAYGLSKLKLVPKWISWLGYIASLIYFLAQADLFATVISGFPVWDKAGMIGSTLWLVWLICVGIRFTRLEKAA